MGASSLLWFPEETGSCLYGLSQINGIEYKVDKVFI